MYSDDLPRTIAAGTGLTRVGAFGLEVTDLATVVAGTASAAATLGRIGTLRLDVSELAAVVAWTATTVGALSLAMADLTAAEAEAPN